MALKLSKSHLADLHDVSVRTISEWQRDPDFPQPAKVGSRNMYDATAVLAWWRDREIGRLIEGEDGRVLDLNHERARLAKAQADRQELQLAKERGALVEIEAVADEVGAEYDNVRARILSTPAKLAPVVAIESDIDVCRHLIAREVHEALAELSADEKETC